mmetsp:Transcript_26269/g.44309  ORF Transcript_26269/g.44309 Transcript_26269/m.44309 type:complete len:593 (+) Transcript_26269:498-2276(+)
MYVKATVQISGVSSIQPLVKMLWFSFLRKWNQLGGRLMDAVVDARKGRASDSRSSAAAAGAEVCPTDSAECLPFAVLVPSRLLLLGLINLACRLSRSWVTPPDLINWCKQERVPYAQAYELLAVEVKQRVNTNIKVQELFTREFSGKGTIHNVTPSNILFYTFEIGKMLDIAVPALNATLFARAMALSLGLPNSALNSHANVLQLLNSSVHARKFRYVTEDIAASLFLACKLDPRWHECCLVRVHADSGNRTRDGMSTGMTISLMQRGVAGGSASNSSEDNPAVAQTLPCPVSGSAADLISVHTLDSFLTQAKSNLRSTLDSKPTNSVGYASFNKIVQRTFISQPELAGGRQNANQRYEYSGDCESENRSSRDKREEVRRSHLELVAPFRNEFNDYLQDYIKSQSKTRIYSNKHNSMSAHPSAVGVCNDQMAMSSAHQLVLLERLARHCQLSPALLNAIFESDDADCVNLAVDALTIFTKRAAQDMQVQRQKERSVFRIGSLLSHDTNSSTVIKDASKLDYVRQCFSMMKRLNRNIQETPPPVIELTSAPVANGVESTRVEIHKKRRKLTVPNEDKVCKKRKVDVGGPLRFS